MIRKLDNDGSQLTFFSQPGQLLVGQQKKQLPRENSGLGMDGMGDITKHQEKTLIQQQGQLVMDGLISKLGWELPFELNVEH